jgi:hypothetical protein
MATTRDLPDAWLSLPVDKCPLLLAHPGTATRFLRYNMAAMRGIKYGRIGHERGSPTAKYAAMISCYYWDQRYWDERGWDPIWHIVREPIKVIYSIATLFHQDAAGRQQFMDYFCAKETDSPLRDMMWTVTEVNRLAEQRASRRFRVEDVPGDRDPKHTHSPAQHYTTLVDKQWQQLEEVSNSYRWQLLLEQTERYGYPLP